MKQLIYLLTISLLLCSSSTYACKMKSEDADKKSKFEVESYIKKYYPNAKFDSLKILNSGRIQVTTKSNIPRLYRVVYSPNCKATVNIVRRN